VETHQKIVGGSKGKHSGEIAVWEKKKLERVMNIQGNKGALTRVEVIGFLDLGQLQSYTKCIASTSNPKAGRPPDMKGKGRMDISRRKKKRTI